jgi:hypothetical protein
MRQLRTSEILPEFISVITAVVRRRFTGFTGKIVVQTISKLCLELYFSKRLGRVGGELFQGLEGLWWQRRSVALGSDGLEFRLSVCDSFLPGKAGCAMQRQCLNDIGHLEKPSSVP